MRRLDFSKYEGRLAESWDYDPATHSWTMHLRHGVKSCAGNEFTADDVIYTLARAKSVSGAAPIDWFLGSVAAIKGFTATCSSPAADKDLGDGVEKVDDHTVRIQPVGANRLFLTVMSVYGTYAVRQRGDEGARDAGGPVEPESTPIRSIRRLRPVLPGERGSRTTSS